MFTFIGMTIGGLIVGYGLGSFVGQPLIGAPIGVVVYWLWLARIARRNRAILNAQAIAQDQAMRYQAQLNAEAIEAIAQRRLHANGR